MDAAALGEIEVKLHVFHPTEVVNVLMGSKAFNGDLRMVYPMNIEKLANLEMESNKQESLFHSCHIHNFYHITDL